MSLWEGLSFEISVWSALSTTLCTSPDLELVKQSPGWIVSPIQLNVGYIYIYFLLLLCIYIIIYEYSFVLVSR
ncbi:unnamed protein product [Prunus brigantina]